MEPGSSSSQSPFSAMLNRLSAWRTSLDLPNPGTVENLQKEVKNTHVTNFMFDGARADLSKTLSANPVFQVTHSFALGSQTNLPSYNFGALVARENFFMQGSVDHEGNVNCRLNQGWTPSSITKVQAQLSKREGQNIITMEHDYQGRDFCLNARAINPTPVDLTGVYTGSYIQSITKNAAIGVEAFYQRPAPGQDEMNLSYLLKYTSTLRDWIATAQVQPSGIFMASYWQKLSEKVDFAAELQLVAPPQSPTRRSAVATLGAKYELRMSTFRAQLDSTGKVSALLEQRLAPTFAFLFSGEIDHFKNAAKVGVGVMIESTSLTPEEMGQTPFPPA